MSAVLTCPACRTRYKVPTYRPSARYLCKKCQAPLSPPEDNGLIPFAGEQGLQAQETVVRPATSPPAAPGAPPRPLFAPAVPERFGDYEVLGEIGRGGMGLVLKAQRTGTSRIVAIKTLLPAAASGDVLHRFHREARSSSRLHHPNIVAVHEVGEAGGLPYFVMDYLPGTTLDKRLKLKPVIPRDAAVWTREIARALAYAHGLGVIHRDLKAANIMMDSDGRPVLMDFGLAKDASSHSVLSMSGDVFGTPSYMPPEQASGHLSEVDARSDLYSLGVLLYEMLTGRLPFQGQNLSETIYKVIHEDPPAPRSLKPRIPADLEAVCMKAMEKEKARRYASAEEMIRDLDRFLGHEDVQARQMTGLTRMGQTVRRKRGVLKAFAAAFAAAGLLFGGGWILTRKRGLDLLAVSLADPLPAVRLKALSDLVAKAEQGRLNPAEEGRAWAFLAAAIADADDTVAKAALSASIRLAMDPVRGPALRAEPGFSASLQRQFTHQDPQLAQAAVDCAGWLEARGTYGALVPLLDNPRRILRVAAVKSLGRLGLQQSLFPLMALAQRDRPMTLEVINAIDRIYSKGAAHPILRKAMAVMPDLLHDNQDHNDRLEEALEGVGEGETDPVVRGLALLRDETRRTEERLQVAYELSRQGDRKTVPGLLACLTLDPEAVGLQAAWAAEELDGRMAVDSLMGTLAKGEGKSKARAALALARPGSPEISQALQLALAADPETGTAEALCRALGRTEDPAAVGYLIRAAERGVPSVKASALASLRILTGRDLGEDPRAYQVR